MSDKDNDTTEQWLVTEWERFERDVDAVEKERLKIIQKNRCDENDLILMEALFNHNSEKKEYTITNKKEFRKNKKAKK
jgi:hypothetical protein